MKTNKKLQIFALALMLCILAFCTCGGAVLAEESEQPAEPYKNNESEDVEPTAFTSLSITLGTRDGYVVAIAKNDFTLFSSTVKVYVQLYSSTTYQQTYNTMTLEAQYYTDDLDMGHSITIQTAINGVPRYWQARIYYKVNTNGWKEKVTNIYFIDIDGTAAKVNG